MTGECNDGRFPDDSAVLARYPVGGRRPASDREAWPWLAGTIEQQCGPDEWLVTMEDRRVARLEDRSPAPAGTPDDDLLFLQCYRRSSELRPAAVRPGGRTVSGWHLWLGSAVKRPRCEV
jgi:hypothetical protein